MIIVADTTPLNYLILIGHSDVLGKLYGRVVIPAAVARELQHSETPEIVRKKMEAAPPWLEIRTVSRSIHPDLEKLDVGEQEAITLAEEFGAEALIIDERAGRRLASRLGLTVIGTLGVLEEAGKLGLVDLQDAIAKLRRTTFRADASLLETMLERHARRIQTGESEDRG